MLPKDNAHTCIKDHPPNRLSKKKIESDSRVIKMLLKSTWNGNQEIKYLFQDFNNQMFKEIVRNIAQKAPHLTRFCSSVIPDCSE